MVPVLARLTLPRLVAVAIVGVLLVPSASVAAPKTGKWRGKFHFGVASGSVSFRLKATGRGHHKRVIRSFKVNGHTGTLYCYPEPYRQYFSTAFSFPKIKVKGRRFTGSQTVENPDAPVDDIAFEIDAVAGHFSGKKKAHGSFEQDFYDSSGTLNCTTGTVEFTAKRK
ncbi:MAG: hypothetical protein ACJ766_18935 [Thermoleophilaceae bacterium]